MKEVLIKVCKECGSATHIEMTKEQLDKYNSGVSIQRVAPHLTTDERELIISGWCGKCFDLLMPEPEEEEEMILGFDGSEYDQPEDITDEQRVMKIFLEELSNEESANGSTLLATTFLDYSYNVEQFDSVKDVAAKVFEAYFDFYTDQRETEEEEDVNNERRRI